MKTRLKNIIVIVSLGVLIYFVSSANTLLAEDSENDAGEQFADAVISVEASVVKVAPEALEEIADEPDIKILNSIPLEKIMQCIREDEGGEVVSVVKLSVRNDSAGEMNREERVTEERKVSDEDVSEHEERENHVSFRAEPTIIDMNRIAVSFDFKQIVSVGALSSVQEVEEQKGKDIVIEISSEVVLRPGHPRIISATTRDEAIFLIMGADI